MKALSLAPERYLLNLYAPCTDDWRLQDAHFGMDMRKDIALIHAEFFKSALELIELPEDVEFSRKMMFDFMSGLGRRRLGAAEHEGLKRFCWTLIDERCCDATYRAQMTNILCSIAAVLTQHQGGPLPFLSELGRVSAGPRKTPTELALKCA
jgi:hypothetical protein